LGCKKLVERFRKGRGNPVEFKFSSITQFAKEMKRNLDMKSLPIKNGDFFPYIETDHNSWTGFRRVKQCSKSY